MPQPPNHADFLNLNRALRATGMAPMDIGTTLAGQIDEFQWPATKTGWLACLPDLVRELTPWNVLVSSIQPLIGDSIELTWPMVFNELRSNLKGLGERVDFLKSILQGHVEGNWPQALFDITFAHCGHAGIHPASVVLCSYPHLNTTKVAELLLNRWGKDGLTPIGRSSGDLDEVIAKWDIDITSFGSLNGLIATREVCVSDNGIRKSGAKPSVKLGDNIVFGSSAEIVAITGLHTLGDNIQVFGDLELNALPNLTTLGSCLTVKGDLVVGNCHSLQSLPKDLRVTGRIYLPDAEPGLQLGNPSKMSKDSLMEIDKLQNPLWRIMLPVELA